MNQRARRIEWLVWGGLVLVILTLLLAFLLAQLKLGYSWGKPLNVIGQVAPFTLTNQDGRTVTLADYSGRVWAADIIFTTCPGPCARMSRQMKDLQAALPQTSQARFVSLTTYPEYDTPPVLKAYAQQRFDADLNRWSFLTGSKKEIAKLAVESLKLILVEKEPAQREGPNDLFIHSTIFVVVDKHGRLRGSFETTGDDIDPAMVKTQILAAIRRLEHEP